MGDEWKMKDPLKALIAVLLSTVFALGITLGAGVVLANEEDHEHTPSELEVAFSSSPRFPVVEEEAEFTFKVSHDGTPEEGLTVAVTLVRMEVGHGHDEAEADNHDEAEADHHDEAENAEVGSAEITAVETAPGVYKAKYTFQDDGKYQATAYIGEEHTEFVVAVRSSPVAWSFLTGLAVVPLLLAGVVAVIKSVRRKW